MRGYLTSDELNTEEKNLLFKLRISIIPLLMCNALVKHPDLQAVIKTIKYDDIFQDLSTQVKAIISVVKNIMGQIVRAENRFETNKPDNSTQMPRCTLEFNIYRLRSHVSYCSC